MKVPILIDGHTADAVRILSLLMKRWDFASWANFALMD